MKTVCILISIPDSKYFDSCTLALKTVRVGFPTADIMVTINAQTSREDSLRVVKMCEDIAAGWHILDKEVHHAAWIAQQVQEYPGTLIILDGDTHFWKSCEDWKFADLIAGYYVPEMWNDFAKCRSWERLHTSFLWFADTELVLDRIKALYPPAFQKCGEYCPLDPFMPSVKFIKGEPVFWDSTAVLYNMLGGSRFGPEHLDCYEHLNSASFFDVMHERLEAKELFTWLHTEAVKDPLLLKPFLWNNVNTYYRQKHLQLYINPPK